MRSIVFDWKKKDFANLLKSCQWDDATPYILRYMPKRGKIVDAGCGLGRYVKYLTNKGYDIEGIEVNKRTIQIAKEMESKLKIFYADITKMPYQDGSIDGIISLGVVEHFPQGPQKPLLEMHRILKPKGRAVITVPSFNLIRQIKKNLYLDELHCFLNPISLASRSNLLRKLLNKKLIKKPFQYNRNKSDWYIYPIIGDFFEYRFTKNQFEEALKKAGFTILESAPIAHLDGIYHEFGRLFISFRNWQFFPNIFGRTLNNLLSKIPFCHNHLHLCVVEKD